LEQWEACARKDSRLLEKAKEPRGRAESDRRRRGWRDVDIDVAVHEGIYESS
jgi:hypothetical protein